MWCEQGSTRTAYYPFQHSYNKSNGIVKFDGNDNMQCKTKLNGMFFNHELDILKVLITQFI